MESIEFLGGRYTRPEQIMSGPVQAFRAQNAANGQAVFIHRVSTTESPQEQAGLLKLLTTALIKSRDAKRLVLDFGEEQGYWYVVTESESQCVLLREWLQMEIDAAAGSSRVRTHTSAPPASKAANPPGPDAADPGEFTRFLKGRPPVNTPSMSLPSQPAVPTSGPDGGEFTNLFTMGSTTQNVNPPTDSGVAPSRTPIARAGEDRMDSGEFTSFFNASDAQRKQLPKQFSSSTSPPPPLVQSKNATSQVSSPQAEPGEFTRFFKEGLPQVPSKPMPPAPQTLSFERTQSSPFVQRPNTPVPSSAPSTESAEKGEFTRLFSRPDNAKIPSFSPSSTYQPAPPVRNDPLGFSKQETGEPNDLVDELFSNRIDIPKPLPSSRPQDSEFTRMFGNGGAASPPVPPQSVVAPPKDKPLLDEPAAQRDLLRAKQPFRTENVEDPAHGEAAGADSPSEFTRISRGGYAPAKTSVGAAHTPAGSAPAASGAAGAPLLNVQVSPINPMGALPHVGGGGGAIHASHASAGVGGASLGGALGSAHVTGPRVPGANLHVPPANLKLGLPRGSANKQMAIFFGVLVVLAVLLILLMLFLMKNK